MTCSTVTWSSTSSAWTGCTSTPTSPTSRWVVRWNDSARTAWVSPSPRRSSSKRSGTASGANVSHFADEHDIPILHLKKPDRTRWDDRKLDHVQPYLEAAEWDGRFGVVAIVAAQEYQWVFSSTKKSGTSAGVWFDWNKTERRVGTFYFYIHDREFGLGFIKICTYFPYPAKVWVNGHEWAKRQARRGRLNFSELANGFAACTKPDRLQAICDAFGPDDLQSFFDRWITAIPNPFSEEDRAAGYWWELSMRQVEVSRTLVFDDPRRARGFFEALVADNVGVGRPQEVAMVFSRPLRRPTKHPYQTRIFSPGTEVKMDFRFKHSRVKQYLKEGRAYRAVGPQSIQNFSFDRRPIQPLPRGHLDINPGALTYL